MIDVVYTGDLRSTKSVSEQNHKLFFDELDKVAKYRVHDFTVPNLADIISSPGEKDFTPCPFDRGGKDQYWVRPYHRRGRRWWRTSVAVYECRKTYRKSIYN
jgi:hypothetical protein